jgi:hypothetical protein
MKKMILLFAIVLIFASCETSKFLTTETYFLDFRPYAEKGFTMSSTIINESFEPIGDISCICTGGYDTKGLKMKEDESGMKYANVGLNKKPVPCNFNDVIEKIYQESLKVGANGIINLKIDAKSPFDAKNSVLSISGLAVKIKK